MKVGLIRLPPTYADWYRHPLLGLSYICTNLEKNGYECRIFDAYFHTLSDIELINRVVEYQPDIIGISAMTHEIVNAARIASLLKGKLNVTIVVGGCHVTALPKRTLREFPSFDYAVYGEGDHTILELIKYLEGGSVDLKSINGLIYRDNLNNVCINEPRPFLTGEELDSLPFPSLRDYYGDDRKALAGKDSFYVIISSRGCPYNCVFCMQVLGRKVRHRSPQNVVDEFKYANSYYGAHTFNIADEIFLYDSAHTREILQMIVDQGLPKRIRWRGSTRVNLVNKEIVQLAKEAGCYRLELGVESGDDEILRTIGKGITVEEIRRAVRIIKDAGLELGTYYILGHPNETLESLKKTVNLAIELNTDNIAVGIMVPYPGTKVYDMALKGEAGYRLLSTDWSEYDKYCGKVLEIKNLPYEELIKWQKRTLVYFYLKNFRLLELFHFLWTRRRALIFYIKKFYGRI